MFKNHEASPTDILKPWHVIMGLKIMSIDSNARFFFIGLLSFYDSLFLNFVAGMIFT